MTSFSQALKTQLPDLVVTENTHVNPRTLRFELTVVLYSLLETNSILIVSTEDTIPVVPLPPV